MKILFGIRSNALVVLFNAVGLSSALVEQPPQIIDPPLTQFAWLGRPVTFKVSYTNTPPMGFQWQWNEMNLPDATNKTYRLASAQLTNGGDYRVILSNGAGMVTSAVARLTVRDMPPPTGVSFTNLSSLERSLQNIMRIHVVPGMSLAVMKDGRLILAPPATDLFWGEDGFTFDRHHHSSVPKSHSGLGPLRRYKSRRPRWIRPNLLALALCRRSWHHKFAHGTRTRGLDFGLSATNRARLNVGLLEQRLRGSERARRAGRGTPLS